MNHSAHVVSFLKKVFAEAFFKKPGNPSFRILPKRDGANSIKFCRKIAPKDLTKREKLWYNTSDKRKAIFKSAQRGRQVRYKELPARIGRG